MKNLLVIAVFSIVPFILTIDGDFCFDDTEAILKNRAVVSENLSDIFYTDFWGTNITSDLSHKSYRPLTVLTFKFNYLLSGKTLNAKHFKIVNVFLHFISCILLYMSMKILWKNMYYVKGVLNVPLWSSLLFAVHPVHVEAVSGIVGRADILAFIYFFLAFLTHNEAIHRKSVVSYIYLVITVVFAAMSMLSKENGVTVLGISFIYEIINHKYYKEKYCAQNKKEKSTLNKPLISRLCILLLCGFLLLFMRWEIMGGRKPTFKQFENPAASHGNFFTRVLSYNYIYFINGLILLWPQWLCFDWAMGCLQLVQHTLDFRNILVLLMYTFGALKLYNTLYVEKVNTYKRLSIMAWSLLVLPFLPASNIFFPVGFVVAERVLYIPSAGFCLLVTLGFNDIMRRWKQYEIQIKTGFTLLLVVFGTKSWHRSRAWRSELALYSSGLAVCPKNAKVHYNVAKVNDLKDPEYAISEYLVALRLHPEYYQAMNNLANLLKDRKRYREAEKYLRKAISLKEDFAAAWMNLGIVLHNMKRFSESEEAYKNAIKYRSVYPDCYFNLGNLYLESKRISEAVDAWKQALAQNPKHIQAWSNLLAFLDNTDKINTAIPLIEKAVSILPNEPAIYFAAANIYGKLEEYKESEKYFHKAISLFGPRAKAIHYANFGVLYHRWKKFREAEAMYRKALSIDPEFESAKKHLRTLNKLINR